MFGLILIFVTTMNDFELWLKYRQLRRDAAEGVERLVGLYIENERNLSIYYFYLM